LFTIEKKGKVDGGEKIQKANIREKSSVTYNGQRNGAKAKKNTSRKKEA